MNRIHTRGDCRFTGLLAALCLLWSSATASAAPNYGLVIQVSDNNPATWNLVLNIAENAPKNVSDPLEVVIVAFGPGLKMLTLDSIIAPRLESATAAGVQFRACGMTMKKMQLQEADLYPSGNIKRVDGGVIEIMRLQKADWSYIRP